MVTAAMRRYRIRSERDAALVLPDAGPVDPAACFGRQVPLRVEIGCGHGEFLSQLAAAHPAEDCIGLELDRLRITKIARKCQAAGASNVRLIQGDAAVGIQRLPDACCHRCYVLFPDPWPKARHRRRRLLNRRFLGELARILKPGGRLIMTSDCHEYALSTLTNVSTLPGLFRLVWPEGYRVDPPLRFTTVFERHKRAEGETVLAIALERRAP